MESGALAVGSTLFGVVDVGAIVLERIADQA